MRALWLCCLIVSSAVATPQGPTPAAKTPREIYEALNGLRVDSSRVYFLRDITLRRDVVRVVFSEGKLAFFQAYDGRILGAVFSGEGTAIAVPRDPTEKRSIARFLETPLVDQRFSRAYLRFTDNTAQELLELMQSRGIVPVGEPSFAEEWNPVVGNLNVSHSQRTLSDWLSATPRPYFYAGLMGDRKSVV